ncbi:MAG: Fe-S protein [Pseudomonadales bacterium RIFCSPLOWO2_12_59_9]|nr:MAG: Fe-S protein [Pseudomonadales bacterium RIFCSPLOWO2_12_59_9]
MQSPCRRQCCLDDTDRCIGCGRLLAEILEWGSASNARRREICAAAQGRLRKPGSATA